MDAKERIKILRKINTARLEINSILEDLQTYIGNISEEEKEEYIPNPEEPPF